MSPGDETVKAMRAIAREEAGDPAAKVEAAARAKERIERERASTRIGWGLFAAAALILVANVAADLMQRQRPEFSVSVVTLVVLLAFGGGALVQGVRLDKILTAWRKNGDAP